jgi:glycosyltransferase involved in cell wall biosynthesis
LNILIDASQFPTEKTGVGVYAVNLIHAIVAMDQRNQYTIIIQDDEVAFESIDSPNVRILKFPARIFRKFFFRFFLEQIVIPYLLLRHKIDLIHSLHYSFPLMTFGSKRVVTIHDMTFFKFPEAHERVKVFYFRLFILLAAKIASRTIADSESTRRDFIARTDAAMENVVTVLLGSPPASQISDTVTDSAPIRHRLGITGEYIMFVGTVEPRKNLLRLILAFARLISEEKDYQLVILGKKGWGYDPVFQVIAELDIADHIVFTGYLGDDEKLQLMKNATLFVYPSLYEGFGLPLLEALSLGLPTITSNVSSLPEVAGSGAIQIDPYDTRAIYQAIKKLLSDEKLREGLELKAREQASRFSWQKTAEKTTAVYKTVLH